LRGALFNGYLAERVADGSWGTALDGEKLISDRPRGSTENDAGGLSNRRSTTGLLWGKKPQWSDGGAGEREQAFYKRFPQTLNLLEKAGCRCSRRVLAAQAGELNWSLQDDQAVLTFALGPGSYATMVVRELVDAKDMALQESEA
jgi:tRNA pseudouridine13 synthase